MSTRNIVPRSDNEGQLGTEQKKWAKIYTNEISATNFIGNLTGTANKALEDNNGNEITSTYATKNELNLKLDANIVGNEANKIPKFNSEGHLILPTGIEIY
ncbi:Uncharacterised protein [Megamonas hypermegale]|uniref:Uncharacterized protein n=1 Tax=Megamonas hypermegale TaxID=158847 RepID=A0A378NSG3_9FIRM|nr:hypothetical protein [Megamonas hypermegale]STY71322.1 Uncharacterised protein [Megamonas hypermegale]